MDPVISRPDFSTCGDFIRYIKLVNDDLFTALNSNATLNLLAAVDEQRSTHRYAEGKWSIKQVLGHITDAERIFVYRALSFARADKTVLPGFDENPYVDNAGFDHVPFASLIDEFKTVRHATIHFFRNLPQEAWERSGKAGSNTLSVRAWGFAIAGHEIHHRNILDERYLRQQE